MTNTKIIKKGELTNNISYQIIDTTIYLLIKNQKISNYEIKIVSKKLICIIEDNDISYINVSGKDLEVYKDELHDLGFTLSYYDVCKLNFIYKNIKNKEKYRCYGIMTKNDFYKKYYSKVDKIDTNKNLVLVSNNGYVSNLLLILFGVCLLCFFSIYGAVYLVK